MTSERNKFKNKTGPAAIYYFASVVSKMPTDYDVSFQADNHHIQA